MQETLHFIVPDKTRILFPVCTARVSCLTVQVPFDNKLINASMLTRSEVRVTLLMCGCYSFSILVYSQYPQEVSVCFRRTDRARNWEIT